MAPAPEAVFRRAEYRRTVEHDGSLGDGAVLPPQARPDFSLAVRRPEVHGVSHFDAFAGARMPDGDHRLHMLAPGVVDLGDRQHARGWMSQVGVDFQALER